MEARIEALEADILSTKGDLRTYIATIEEQKKDFADQVALALATHQNALGEVVMEARNEFTRNNSYTRVYL